MVRSEDMEEHLLLRRRFGARLRSLREERGWSIEEACLRFGYSRSYYYKIEAGQAEISFSMLAKLAREFRLDPIDFFTFPDTTLRHGIYEMLRRSAEAVLLRTKLSLLGELGGATGLPAPVDSEPHQPHRKRATR